MSLALVLFFVAVTEPDVPEAIAVGDSAFARIDYAAASLAYEQALVDHPREPELLWRLSRVYVCRGEVADGEMRQTLLRQAEKAARQCVAMDSLKSQGHTWLAGALGYLALEEDLSRKIALTHELKKEALRAIELDPDNDAAYSILGSFYRALGNASWFQKTVASVFFGSVPEGGYEEAERALKKAVDLAPDVMRHEYELGVLYLDMGKKAEARAALEKAAGLPIRTAIDRPRLERIKGLLSDISER